MRGRGHAPAGTPAAAPRGFTLLELMIVVTILAIISAIGVPQYMSALRTARIGKAKHELVTISNAVQAFAANNDGQLPLTLHQVGFGARTDPWGTPYQYGVVGNVLPSADRRRDPQQEWPRSTDSPVRILRAAYQALFLKITAPGWTSLVFLQVLFSGAILIAIGLVGDYLARIYEEAKGRPLYIVHDSANVPLEQRVRSYLDANGSAAFRSVVVATDTGTVTLTGTVTSFFAKQLAQEFTRRVSGVVSVINLIEVTE